MTNYNLKLFVENCGQIAADRHMVTIDSLLKFASVLPHMVPSLTPTTYRLATIPHDWYNIMRYDPSRSPNFNDFHVIKKLICDFLLVINSNLSLVSLFSHNAFDDNNRRQATDDTSCHRRSIS